MSPSGRAVALLAVAAGLALIVPLPIAALVIAFTAGAVLADAWQVREPPEVRRHVPEILARGVPSVLSVEPADDGGRVVLRQTVPPDMDLNPREAGGILHATLTPRRRGRHVLPATAIRTTGPLGLGRWDHRAGDDAEVLVYPDLPAARRLARAVRQGTLRSAGNLTRGALGLGTDFEYVRDYSPDDDIRQVNWRATARLDRPMSNQYRLDQDRDVMCVLDVGRLMAAPLADRTRLDASMDAAAAVAAVADEVGDRCGAVAFDDGIRRFVPARRRGGDAVVRALFDIEPSAADSDYELAFRTIGALKRSFVLVLTDLLDEGAAQTLLEAVPVLVRHHGVVIASVADPDLLALVRTPPARPLDVYAASVAIDVLEVRRRVAHHLTRLGAIVVEAAPDGLGPACVAEYLRMKARARL